MSNSESESKQIIFEETIRSNRRARKRRIREKKTKKIQKILKSMDIN